MPEGLDVRACPACGEPMTRPDSDEGCMTMRCPNCTHYFGWNRALVLAGRAPLAAALPLLEPNADVSLVLRRRQLGIIPDGVVGTIVEDPRDHTWCNSACVVASTRRDWIAVVTSNDGTHARWNPVLARLILSPVCGRLEVWHSGPAGKCTRSQKGGTQSQRGGRGRSQASGNSCVHLAAAASVRSFDGRDLYRGACAG